MTSEPERPDYNRLTTHQLHRLADVSHELFSLRYDPMTLPEQLSCARVALAALQQFVGELEPAGVVEEDDGQPE